jgi:hypothetical protein
MCGPALCGIARDLDPALCGIALDHDPGLGGMAQNFFVKNLYEVDPAICGFEMDRDQLIYRYTILIPRYAA